MEENANKGKHKLLNNRALVFVLNANEFQVVYGSFPKGSSE